MLDLNINTTYEWINVIGFPSHRDYPGFHHFFLCLRVCG